MKRIILLLLVLLSFQTVLGSDYTISKNSVYINDTQAYISATPHTLKSDGYVYITLQTKNYDGGINAVFGFNNSATQPRSLEVFTGETTYTDENGSEYTVESWETLDYDVHIERQFNNKTDWYIFTGRNVNAGQTYKLRMLLDVKDSGKYDFAVYPSSYGRNIGQAIDNGHIYILDPWYEDYGSLIGYWDFHTGNGTTIYDLSNNSYNIPVEGGMIWSEDYPIYNIEGNGSPYSGEFDGVDDRGRTDYNGQLKTFGAWFKSDEWLFNGRNNAIASQRWASGIESKGEWLIATCNDSMVLNLYKGSNANWIGLDVNYYVVPNQTINETQWNFIGLVIEPIEGEIGGRVVVYFNDERIVVDETTEETQNVFLGGDYFAIADTYNADNFDGNIDDVFIANVAYNETQMKNAYNYMLPYYTSNNTAPNITSYYPENLTVERFNVTFPYNITFNITYTDEENDSSINWSSGQRNVTEITRTYEENTTENITVIVYDAEYNDTVTWNVNVTGTTEAETPTGEGGVYVIELGTTTQFFILLLFEILFIIFYATNVRDKILKGALDHITSVTTILISLVLLAFFWVVGEFEFFIYIVTFLNAMFILLITIYKVSE